MNKNSKKSKSIFFRFLYTKFLALLSLSHLNYLFAIQQKLIKIEKEILEKIWKNVQRIEEKNRRKTKKSWKTCSNKKDENIKIW